MPINKLVPYLGPTALAAISAAVNEGRGAAAQVLGQTYNVYRLGTQSNAVTSGTPLYTGFQARIHRVTSKAKIENETFGLLTYTAICDASFLNIQDVLVETAAPGAPTDGGVFIHAQSRPTRDNIWVRVEQNASITRPTPKGGAAYQQPISGAFASPGYGGIPKNSEAVLTLTNGFYTFALSGGIPASVPVGIQAIRAVKDGKSLGTPTDLYRDHYLMYIPELPGELLNELDRINLPTQDRYEIAMIFSTNVTGLSGNICIVEKLGV